MELGSRSGGSLSQMKLGQLVSQIPGLEPEEQKFILAYLYQQDTNEDGMIDYGEMKAAVATFLRTHGPTLD